MALTYSGNSGQRESKTLDKYELYSHNHPKAYFNSMTESQLRDLIAKDIQVLEKGLTLLKKEKYIPSSLGTRGFIDLYAKDTQGHHVLIELKRSNASAREALHEIHKYVEGVKEHFGARDHEIRILVASTEWTELLVPFSRLVADTKLSITGLQLQVNEKAKTVTASLISVLSITQGRFIAPWHEVNWYLDRDSLEKGLASFKTCCTAKGIEDYVIVVLRSETPVHSERQATMRTTIRRISEAQGADTNKKIPELPQYQFIAYFALQALTVDQCLRILDHPERNEELRELIKDMETEEALQYLHDEVAAFKPRSKHDFFEIGYPAKLTAFMDTHGFQVESLLRRGIFERNAVLDDKTILSELRGSDGATGQRLRRTVTVSNRAHMSSIRADVASCLEQNPVWKNHILRALDDIELEFPKATVEVSIYNPATAIFTLYFVTTKENGVLFLPSYSLRVHNPEQVRMYYGALEAAGQPLTYRKILNKYYDGDLGNLLTTTTCGGRESRDVDIIEDIGAAYRSYRCDINGERRTCFKFQEERWRSCELVHLIGLFDEYLNKNDEFVRLFVGKIAAYDHDGHFEYASTEMILAESVDADLSRQRGQFLGNAPEKCALCNCLHSEEKYMVHGKLPETSERGYMCADCFGLSSGATDLGIPQIYLRDEGRWLLVTKS